MPKSTNQKGNQINIRLGDEMVQSLEKCCELLSVNKSDFVRFAINQAINQTMLQGVCTMMYEQMKDFDLKDLTVEKVAEFQTMLELLKNIGDTSTLK